MELSKPWPLSAGSTQSTKIRSPYVLRDASRARIPNVPVIRITIMMKKIEIIVAARTANHSLSVRRVSGRPVSRSSSSLLPQATMRSVKVHHSVIMAAQTDAIPTQPSSNGFEAPLIMSIIRKIAMTADVTLMAFAGKQRIGRLP